MIVAAVGHHVVARWRQRVDREASPAAAGAAIAAFLAESELSETPPAWMALLTVRGTEFYATTESRPDVCIVLHGGKAALAAVTVITAQTAAERERVARESANGAWQRAWHLRHQVRRQLRRQPNHRRT